MITNIDLSGIGLDITDSIKAYVHKKIGKLDRLTPRYVRKSLRADVKLHAERSQSSDKYTCIAILHLTDGPIEAHESTLNLLAAVDIVEAKLKSQLKKYKEEHVGHARERRRAWLRNLLKRS